MQEIESARLCEILLSQERVSPILNVGSSTREFRERVKPHIDGRLFRPLREAGVEVVHFDRKQADGVDISGDILDPATQGRLKKMRFRSVLLSNVLEHVRDRAAVVAACEDIVGPGGLILATVPSSFPYHADPLDSGYRPTAPELATAFTRSRPLLAEELAGETFGQRIAASGSSLWREIPRTALWMLASPLRPRSARARLDRWRWFRRPYRVGVALVEVNSPAATPS